MKKQKHRYSMIWADSFRGSQRFKDKKIGDQSIKVANKAYCYYCGAYIPPMSSPNTFRCPECKKT